jgi:hypothetical protein
MLDIKNSFLRSLLEYYTTRGGGGIACSSIVDFLDHMSACLKLFKDSHFEHFFLLINYITYQKI